MNDTRAALSRLGLVLLLVLTGWLLLQDAELHRSDLRELGDFEAYYRAGVDAREGVNPYAAKVRPLPYPPYTLPLFRALATLERERAAAVWLGLNAAFCALGLLLLHLIFTRRSEAGWVGPACLLLIALFGFHDTGFRALSTGNVVVVEQILIWTGIFVLVRHRSVWGFTLLVALGASIKLTPALFLILPFLLEPRRRHLFVPAAGALGLVLANACARLLRPELYAGFLGWAKRLASSGPGGAADPSSWNLIADTLGEGALGLGARIGWILAVGLAFALGLRRIGRPARPQDVVALFCVAFVLVVPRMKDYAWLVLIGPAAWIAATTFPRGRAFALASAAAVCLRTFDYAALYAAVFLLVLLVGAKLHRLVFLRSPLLLAPLALAVYGLHVHAWLVPRTLDLERELGGEYDAGAEPAPVESPAGRFLAVEGRGEPTGAAFEQGLQALRAVAAGLRFMGLKDGRAYELTPVEAEWWGSDAGAEPYALLEQPREEWRWRLLARVPDFVGPGERDAAVAALAQRPWSPQGIDEVELVALDARRYLQVLHPDGLRGKRKAVQDLAGAAAQRGLAPSGRHREIYLADPDSAAPWDGPTVLRAPLR